MEGRFLLSCLKPFNFQWTVLRCDRQVAQELNRGASRVIPDLLQAPLPIFKRHESDTARKMREGGGSSFKIKKGKTLRGTDARATTYAIGSPGDLPGRVTALSALCVVARVQWSE